MRHKNVVAETDPKIQNLAISLHKHNLCWKAIAKRLNDLGYFTARGKPWTPSHTRECTLKFLMYAELKEKQNVYATPGQNT